MVKAVNTFATFRPAEIERITGISTTLQRDWRRRGLIRKQGDGWSEYDLDDLITFFIANVLIERGISASDATAVAGLTHTSLLAYISERSTEFAKDLPAEKRRTWAERLPEVAKRKIIRRYLAIADRGLTASHHKVSCDDISKAFELWKKKGISAGAAIVLDFHTLADQLVQKAGKPLMRVETRDE